MTKEIKEGEKKKLKTFSTMPAVEEELYLSCVNMESSILRSSRTCVRLCDWQLLTLASGQGSPHTSLCIIMLGGKSEKH